MSFARKKEFELLRVVIEEVCDSIWDAFMTYKPRMKRRRGETGKECFKRCWMEGIQAGVPGAVNAMLLALMPGLRSVSMSRFETEGNYEFGSEYLKAVFRLAAHQQRLDLNHGHSVGNGLDTTLPLLQRKHRCLPLLRSVELEGKWDGYKEASHYIALPSTRTVNFDHTTAQKGTNSTFSQRTTLSTTSLRFSTVDKTAEDSAETLSNIRKLISRAPDLKTLTYLRRMVTSSSAFENQYTTISQYEGLLSDLYNRPLHTLTLLLFPPTNPPKLARIPDCRPDSHTSSSDCSRHTAPDGPAPNPSPNHPFLVLRKLTHLTSLEISTHLLTRLYTDPSLLNDVDSDGTEAEGTLWFRLPLTLTKLVLHFDPPFTTATTNATTNAEADAVADADATASNPTPAQMHIQHLVAHHWVLYSLTRVIMPEFLNPSFDTSRPIGEPTLKEVELHVPALLEGKGEALFNEIMMWEINSERGPEVLEDLIDEAIAEWRCWRERLKDLRGVCGEKGVRLRVVYDGDGNGGVQ